MVSYRLAGQDVRFPCPLLELEAFEVIPAAPEPPAFVPHSFFGNGYSSQSLPVPPAALLCRTAGWVGGEQRQVETWSTPPGTLLRVLGGSDIYISPGGLDLVPLQGRLPKSELTGPDRETLLGPALVLALAMQGIWSLHASAVMLQGRLVAFLGESGQGKSTLAGYLASTGWELVADDILPVTWEASGVLAWPRFPQLKLPAASQPGLHLPEQIPLDEIFVLVPIPRSSNPEVLPLSPGEAAKALLSHTAGTRLFTRELLGNHLEFCTRAAGRLRARRLAYPLHREALALVKDLLEKTC